MVARRKIREHGGNMLAARKELTALSDEQVRGR